ncbi:MAG: ABC transporter permease [Neisseriaceae bacterium]|nr:ABC transporter permease [Neisseriaceae bacterium]
MTLFKSKTSKAYVLLAPLLLFLLVFFLWPLLAMMKQSVVDDAVAKVLQQTAVAMGDWDGQSTPGRAIEHALMADIQVMQDERALGDMVRKLNSEQAGFRTLMTKTIAAVKQQTEPTGRLPDIDARWAQPQYWQAINKLLSPVTSRYLLAAVDMGHNQAGQIVKLPAEQSANREILLRTFSIALTVTVFCVLIGYPYALLLAAATGWWRNLLFMAVLLPLWTSLLVRTAAWFILLQNKGLINDALIGLGFIEQPIALIFNRVGVVVAMTHVLLPFMVLPIYSVLKTIPSNLMPAASSLGAAPWRAFLKVLLPLSYRGILSGMLLVFMTAIGYYITPALIGGPGDQMISAIIAYYATGAANWGMAGALGVILLITCLILFSIYSRMTAEKREVI